MIPLYDRTMLLNFPRVNMTEALLKSVVPLSNVCVAPVMDEICYESVKLV